MKVSDVRFLWRGDEIRVLVVGDVLALPNEEWSCGGFARSITVEWLLHETKLPGVKERKRALADCLVRALDHHHAGGAAEGDGDTRPRGPMVPCPRCGGSSFVPATGGTG